MLRELHISNLAVIEDARMTFGEGLNVFTGQTGAGKSLVIGAFEALLGLRKASDMVRPGAGEARLQGVFEVDDDRRAAGLAAALDQPVAEGDELLITRKLFPSGRSSLSVNGQLTTAAMMRRAAELLVDIHGQHDHQVLLKPGNQLLLLDAHAGCEADRAAFSALYAERRTLAAELERVAEGAELRRQQLELYRFQAGEIDAAEPRAGEFNELSTRDRVLSNVVRLQNGAGQAHEALYDADGSAVERVQAISHTLRDLAETDDALADVAEQVRGAALTLQEAAFDLGRYVNRLELDPEEAGEVSTRLDVLNRLVQKYGERRRATSVRPAAGGAADADPVADVLAVREGLRQKIDDLTRQAELGDSGDAKLAKLDAELAGIAERLTAARTKAAADLAPKIERELKQLGMADAKLSFAFEPAPDATTGRDAVEIVVQTNPGQDARPLRRIASGGELSRVMLALKGVASGGGAGGGVSVLVFDEVDANIGGRLGAVIGGKLRALANGARAGRGRAAVPSRQVLCITHLPQIAAYGDRHFRIVKQVEGRGGARITRTTVEHIEAEVRVDELAEMLTGNAAGDVSREQARELLEAGGRGPGRDATPSRPAGDATPADGARPTRPTRSRPTPRRSPRGRAARAGK